MSSTGPSDRCTFVAVLAEQYSPAVNISESPGRKKPGQQAGLGEHHHELAERTEAGQSPVRLLLAGWPRLRP